MQNAPQKDVSPAIPDGITGETAFEESRGGMDRRGQPLAATEAKLPRLAKCADSPGAEACRACLRYARPAVLGLPPAHHAPSPQPPASGLPQKSKTFREECVWLNPEDSPKPILPHRAQGPDGEVPTPTAEGKGHKKTGRPKWSPRPIRFRLSSNV